ncbi:MAG: DNA cytosine methyltransferase [bacterium]|nr:DNA cytosine methyltransferase [bacterium]
MEYLSVDIFSGCGGLSEGMSQAGFKVIFAIDNNKDAVTTYKMNHPTTKVIEKDIRKVNTAEITDILNGRTLHFLAGCPPCQGFSSVRRLNKKENVDDNRNDLILQYLRLVNELKPLTIMMENVPGLTNYYLFNDMMKKLKKLEYNPKARVIDVKDYGVPQRRKRLVMVGSLLGELNVAEGIWENVTVRDSIGNLEPVDLTNDPIHKMTVRHTQKILKMITLIPKNGGSRTDLPKKYILECHKKDNVGFNDIYGRLKWDNVASTITGGCLNPSKGRFLHPEADRCITPREAALLQSFPENYKFPTDISKTSLASLIGNALPPKFSYIQSKNIKEHLDKYLG